MHTKNKQKTQMGVLTVCMLTWACVKIDIHSRCVSACCLSFISSRAFLRLHPVSHYNYHASAAVRQLKDKQGSSWQHIDSKRKFEVKGLDGYITAFTWTSVSQLWLGFWNILFFLVCLIFFVYVNIIPWYQQQGEAFTLLLRNLIFCCWVL